MGTNVACMDLHFHMSHLIHIPQSGHFHDWWLLSKIIVISEVHIFRAGCRTLFLAHLWCKSRLAMLNSILIWISWKKKNTLATISDAQKGTCKGQDNLVSACTCTWRYEELVLEWPRVTLSLNWGGLPACLASEWLTLISVARMSFNQCSTKRHSAWHCHFEDRYLRICTWLEGTVCGGTLSQPFCEIGSHDRS